jgi:hypothetical protein
VLRRLAPTIDQRNLLQELGLYRTKAYRASILRLAVAFHSGTPPRGTQTSQAFWGGDSGRKSGSQRPEERSQLRNYLAPIVGQCAEIPTALKSATFTLFGELMP